MFLLMLQPCGPHSRPQALNMLLWHFPPQVLINLGLVYKVQQHNGIIFQFVAFIRRRQRAVPEILAAGGRYDLLVRAHPAASGSGLILCLPQFILKFLSTH